MMQLVAKHFSTHRVCTCVAGDCSCSVRHAAGWRRE